MGLLHALVAQKAATATKSASNRAPLALDEALESLEYTPVSAGISGCAHIGSWQLPCEGSVALSWDLAQVDHTLVGFFSGRGSRAVGR